MASSKSDVVLDRIARSATEHEKKALADWADALLTIKASDRSLPVKIKDSIAATSKFEAIRPIITMIGKELTPRALSELTNELVALYNSDATAISKGKKATTLISLALKDLAWGNRSLPARLGIAAAVVTAITLGGQGAGIAALGTAIGVPLWVLFGAGAMFLGELYERFTGKKHRVDTTHTVIVSRRTSDDA